MNEDMLMNWQAIKEMLAEFFHNLSLGNLYHQDPELRPIPVETRNDIPRRPR